MGNISPTKKFMETFDVNVRKRETVINSDSLDVRYVARHTVVNWDVQLVTWHTVVNWDVLCVRRHTVVNWDVRCVTRHTVVN
jgi:hypothetical protein